jgi:thiol-disulfide isomerase/thioredoxin
MQSREGAGRRTWWLVHLSAALVLTFCAVSVKAAPSLRAGDIPPDLQLETFKGERVRFADLRGKVVILSFWATWCPPCRKELPVLAGIQGKATREKLVVLAVNWKQSEQEFRAFARAIGTVDLTLISDESGSIGRKFAVNGIPHMVLIGRDGKIAAIHVGYADAGLPGLANEINTLLSQPAPPNS